MGIKREISLDKVNKLFPNYIFTNIIQTTDGIMDTTFILIANEKKFILKYYERDLKEKIILIGILLEKLKNNNLNVSTLIEFNDGWYLYTFLNGSHKKILTISEISLLGSFLASFHNLTYHYKDLDSFLKKKEIKENLNIIKKKSFLHFKKLCYLQNLNIKIDGFIHGDLFKDNVVFDQYQNKIGVFDFIDGGSGNFIFDCGIALYGFNINENQNFFIRVFLNAYNQKTIRKINKKELMQHYKYAKNFYQMKHLFRKSSLKS